MSLFILVLVLTTIGGTIVYFDAKQQQKHEAKRAEQIMDQRLSEILTSSHESIPGKRILHQIKMISVEGNVLEEVETNLLFKAREAGANAIVNMKINRVTKGGLLTQDANTITMQGDAVMIES
jgi:hypothetical protein